MPKISVIIPHYYNEVNVPVTGPRLIANEALFGPEVEFEYVLVNDGSKDGTLRELLAFRDQYPDRVRVVDLAANVGSYNAMVAGMEYATGDANVLIMADLQDPPELMAQMYEYWKQGIPLVIGNRQDREEQGLGRWFAVLFHYLMKRIAIPTIPDGGFDYVFFDRRVRDELVRMKERNSNVLYMMVYLGFPYVSLPYTRRKREIGKSRWTLQKKVKLFVDSILAFSFFPIRAISLVGLVLGLIAFAYGLYVIVLKLVHPQEPAGWSALMVVLLFVSAFQMTALGVIGEYVWRSLDAARVRPLYVVKDLYAGAELAPPTNRGQRQTPPDLSK